MIPKILTNFNLYVNGRPQSGKAKTVTPPAVQLTMIEHQGGGMFGKAKIPVGHDALEMQFTMAEYAKDVMREAGKPIDIPVTMYGHADDGQGNTQAVSYFCRGKLSVTPDSATPGQDNGVSFRVDCTALRIVVDGTTTHDIDVPSGRFIVDGMDYAASMRANTRS